MAPGVFRQQTIPAEVRPGGLNYQLGEEEEVIAEGS